MNQSYHSSGESKPKVVAAIPCFNTKRFIKEIVSRARKHVDQVIVIDDGSYDGTAEVARAAGLGIREVAISCRYHPYSSSMNPVIHSRFGDGSFCNQTSS